MARVRTRRRRSSALNIDIDELQAGFDKTTDRIFGKLSAALARPAEGTDLAKMPLDELKTYTRGHEDNFIAQTVLGEALRKSGDLDESIRAFEQPRPSPRWRPARTRRTRRLPKWRCRRKTPRGRSLRSKRCSARTSTTSARPASWRG
jgi:hypothetical protein